MINNANLPVGWKWVRLGEVAEIINGSTPKTHISEYWNGDVVWATPTDLGKLSGKYISKSERMITEDGYRSANTNLLPENSIVLSTRAPIGHIAINKVSLCTNQGCKGIIPTRECDTDYLYYYLYFSKKYLDSLGSGSTFKELSTTSLESVEILLPPLAEQRRIAAIIDAQLAAVDKAKKAAAEQQAAAEALKAQKYNDIFKNYSDDIVTIASVCKDISDGTHFTPNYIPTGIPFISVKDLTGGKISFDGCRHISAEEHSNLIKRCKPEYGDVLYTKVGTTGVAKAVDIHDEFSLFVSVALLKLKDEISPVYIEKALNLPFCKKQAEKLTQGATNKNLVIQDLKKIELFCPDYKSQMTIVDKINKVDLSFESMQSAMNVQSEAINAMPAAILRQAFAGEI